MSLSVSLSLCLSYLSLCLSPSLCCFCLSCSLSLTFCSCGFLVLTVSPFSLSFSFSLFLSPSVYPSLPMSLPSLSVALVLWVSLCHLLCLSQSFSFSCSLLICMLLDLFLYSCLSCFLNHISKSLLLCESFFVPIQTLSHSQQCLEQSHFDILLFYREAVFQEACKSPLHAETRRSSFWFLLFQAVHGFHGSSSRGSATSTFYTSSPWKLNICPSFRLS